MSKDDSLDVAEAIWGKALIAWERVVHGIAMYLGRNIELVATQSGKLRTNGIRLHWADVRSMAEDILDLLNENEIEDAVASMDRLMIYDMSETSRLKLLKPSRALDRGEIQEAKEALQIMLS